MPVWTCVPQVSNSVAEQEVVREGVVTSVMDMEVFIFSSISFIIKGDNKKKYKNTKRIRKRVGGEEGEEIHKIAHPLGVRGTFVHIQSPRPIFECQDVVYDIVPNPICKLFRLKIKQYC